MSNRLFQGVVHQMKEAINQTIGVLDENGTIIACSELPRIGESLDLSNLDIVNNSDFVVNDGVTYKQFGAPGSSKYILFIDGDDEQSEKFASVLCISLSNIKQYYDEKYDRSNFIKNIILDNILPGDIYIKTRELRFDNEVSRVVLLVRLLSKNDISAYDVLSNLFPDKSKDFVININETDIAIVKEIKSNIETKYLEKLARSIVDTLSGEFYTHAICGIGNVVNNIKDLALSFKEAQVALEVCKVFET